jgi:sulfonate transport system permease protein
MPTATIAAPTCPALPWRAMRVLRHGVVALLVPGGLLLLWSASARFGWLPPQILPSPSEVGISLLDMARSGDLAQNTLISLLRVVEGFAAGSLLGLLLA